MVKKKLLYLSFLLFVISKSFSQVNLQTGAATFSLPVFNWQDDKSRLNSVIALSYSSGNGLKVNDISSNFGQGWNLIAGGSITRMQVGEPDDQMAYGGNGSEKDIRKFPNGILYANDLPENGCPDALGKYPIYKSKNQVYKENNEIAEDKQLDYFSFQFNNKAGMFVLNKNGDVGVPLGDTKLKITFARDPLFMNGIQNRTTIRSFSIQDIDGLIYRFTKLSTSKVLEMNYCDAGLTQKHTQPKFEAHKVYNQRGFENVNYVYPNIVTGWYLSEIEDPLTHRKITLSYITRNINTIAGQDITYNWEGDYPLISHHRSVSTAQELVSITYPDGHMVALNYGAERFDFKNEYVVSSIDVTYQSSDLALPRRFLSRYQLNTSYFILTRYGTPNTADQKKVARLCLLSITKLSVDLKEDSPPYKFDYWLGSSASDGLVPEPFSCKKDIWGYYNGDNSQGYGNENIAQGTVASMATWQQLKGLCFLRSSQSNSTPLINPKGDYAKNGLLRQIIYPTGGTLTYTYIPNTGAFTTGGPQEIAGGVHVSETSLTDGGNPGNCANIILTQYNYRNENSTSSLWGLEFPVNKMTTTTHYSPEKRIWRYTLGCFIIPCCKFKYQYPGILSLNQSISLSDAQKGLVALGAVLDVVSAIMTVIDVVKYVSSATGPVFVIIDIIASIITAVLSCTNNPSKNNVNTIFYNSDLNQAGALPAQFKRVEVVENPGTIGKTITEFTSDEDYPVWELSNPAFSAKQRFAPWAYGLPKRIAVLKADGISIVKETLNTYNFGTHYGHSHCLSDHYDRTLLLKKEIEIPSCKCMVLSSTSQKDPDWRINKNVTYTKTSNSDIGVDIYSMYTGRAELNIAKERTYKTGSSQFLETVTKYAYNDENYEVSLINTTESDGKVTQKNIYYTIDYVKVHGGCYDQNPLQTGTTNSQINTLVNQNIISLPIETSTMLNPQGTALYLSDQATVLTTMLNGDIKPSQILTGRFASPTSRTSFWQSDILNSGYNLPQPLYDPAGPDMLFYKTTQAFVYDASSNLIGLKDEGNRMVANIYDYDDKYVIASVVNANVSVDNPAYTSFETPALGGWSLTGSPAYSTDGVTGLRSFGLNGKSLARNINTTKAYILSFWASNSSVVVNGGATLVKSTPVVNGFTYFEYTIAQGTPTVSVSGNANLDELRVYPYMARMRTVTYDPLIGKTSECDENNRINYYEYDNLGRIRLIKDEKSNVVKMYEYNNVTSSGCPGTYANHSISEIFTKNSCSAGYQGGDTIIRLAAGIYTSIVSQADADAQAENYLLTNGQTLANTTGSCSLIYYNAGKSVNDTTESCAEGSIGGIVTYAVPAARYSSIISQADADQKEQDDIDANAQAYANDPAHEICTLNNAAVWEWDNINAYCQNISGALPAHFFVKETDVNPNSSTYYQTRWQDTGPGTDCPSDYYFNIEKNITLTRNNCGTGYTGTSATYTVPAGKYSSTISLAAANQLAINDVNANGQSYANTNGGCISNCSFSAYSGFSITTSSISSSGGTVSFYIVFNSTSGTTNWSASNQVATINANCRPSSNRTLTMSGGGGTWQVNILSSGIFSIVLIGGTPPSGTNSFGLTGGSYSL